MPGRPPAGSKGIGMTRKHIIPPSTVRRQIRILKMIDLIMVVIMYSMMWLNLCGIFIFPDGKVWFISGAFFSALSMVLFARSVLRRKQC